MQSDWEKKKKKIWIFQRGTNKRAIWLGNNVGSIVHFELGRNEYEDAICIHRGRIRLYYRISAFVIYLSPNWSTTPLWTRRQLVFGHFSTVNWNLSCQPIYLYTFSTNWANFGPTNPTTVSSSASSCVYNICHPRIIDHDETMKRSLRCIYLTVIVVFECMRNCEIIWFEEE